MLNQKEAFFEGVGLDDSGYRREIVKMAQIYGYNGGAINIIRGSSFDFSLF